LVCCGGEISYRQVSTMIEFVYLSLGTDGVLNKQYRHITSTASVSSTSSMSSLLPWIAAGHVSKVDAMPSLLTNV
jgi:hypothetical protein